MPLIAATVCPHPPLLVESVGRGLDLPVRAVAEQSVRRLVDAAPDLVVLVGADRALTHYDASAVGSLACYGVDEEIGLGLDDAPPAPAALPLSLTVGAWLLHRAGWSGPRRALGIPDSMTPPEALALGREIAAAEERVAVLCLGDASARRSEKAPGWWDGRAPAFDASVAAALAGADLDALAALDPDLARGLLAAGRASWQVLTGAATGSGWHAELRYDDAPYGVGYLVADWVRADR